MPAVEWWPVADGGAWEWAWRPYPGVWLFLTAIGLAYAAGVRRVRARARRRGEEGVARWQLAAFGGGLALLWVSLDWPLGPLAAGYLATANAGQDLIVTLGAAPLLLLGLPASTSRGGDASRLLGSARRLLGQPLIAAAAFGVTLAATHLPGVVDTLRPEPWGSFAITSAWLLSAVVLWTPLSGPLAGRHRLPYFGVLLFLAVPFVFPKIAGAFFVFAETPLYEVYAGAPRVFEDVSALQDQHAAGLVMWVIGSLLVVAALGVLFQRWYSEDRRISTPDSLEVPADPRAVDLLFEVPGGWAALEQLVAGVEAALPPGRTGAELAFAFPQRDERGADAQPSTQVILELRVALDDATEAALAQHIERQHAAFLGRLAPARREQIARVLAFRVVGYGSRVS
jgi:cytochrome c oxidase assembly factor CtaG